MADCPWDATFKPKLQNYTSSKYLPDPFYETAHIPNTCLFISRVSVKDRSFRGTECGSPENAERSAANVALVCLGITPPPPGDLTPEFKQLKALFEGLLDYTMVLEKCLKLMMKIYKAGDLNDACPDLLRQLEDHKENLRSNLRGLDSKIKIC